LFYDDIVHEFAEIMQNKGHFAVQGHSRSPILVPAVGAWLNVTDDIQTYRQTDRQTDD